MKKNKNIEEKQKPSYVEDERFAHIQNNPIFRRVPAQEKRIDVDERFHSMFHDSKFKLNYKVDKRGKPIAPAKSDTRLGKYYTPVESEEKEEISTKLSSKKKSKEIKREKSDSDGSSEENDIKEEKDDKSSSDSSSEEEGQDGEENNDIHLGNYKSTLSEDVRKKLRDADIDYARGETAFASEESSDEDSSDTEEEEDENLMHEWGEIDKDAPRTEDATSRLALCNMDWDNLKAVDLLILFNSFLPAEGVLKNVTIYPSEFGKERMAEEDVHGPKELSETVINDSSDDRSDNEREDEDVDEYHMEKLRKYQLNRLKYYYAVLQFGSVEAAEKVYSECDGMEFESSATRIDLRFIPEDMTFDDVPKDKCDQIPEAEKYRPRFFTTTALQQIKVDLTWDETDPMRKELTELMFDPKAKVDDEDLNAYLASSSSESEEEVNVEENAKELEKTSQKDRLAKYRSLLEGIEENKNKEKDDVQMEITWGVGLKKKAEELVKKKNEEKLSKDLTPWEEMLGKQKDKKKQRRQEKHKKAVEVNKDGEESDDKPFSDDDVDVDFNDDFFKEEIASNSTLKNLKRDKKKTPENNTEEVEQSKAALELLMMDDEDNKSHFSLKQIMADSADKGKKKKKRKGKPVKEPKNVTDNFEINVEDDRFSALFSSHHFNVDPSDPNYKKTEAMEKIITEKIKRRSKMPIISDKGNDKESNPAEDHPLDKSAPDNSSKEKFELQSLVKSIKRKAELMKTNSKQKKFK